MKNLEKFFWNTKTMVCVVILALICAGTAFAQQARPAAQAASSAKKNAITLDVMPLVKGILASNQDEDLLYVPISVAYEIWIAPHMSIGPSVDIYFGKFGEEPGGDDIPYLYFGLAAAWRYYFMSEQMEKLFVGALLGFNAQSIDGKTKEEDGGFAGPVIGVNFGYKALLGKSFFLEPSMSYIYAKNNGLGPTPLGWQGGLRLGIEF